MFDRETLPPVDDMSESYNVAIPLAPLMVREERVSVPDVVLVTNARVREINVVMFEIVTFDDPVMVNAVELTETDTPLCD